jgi:GDP-mannose 6-dehydrogenase
MYGGTVKISVFGLGYVGCVSAACLAKEGHEVVGVDVNPLKVQMINEGNSPIIEKDLDTVLQDAMDKTKNPTGSLSATADTLQAVKESDISMICVGTPSRSNGSLNLEYVLRCAKQIGEGLKEKDEYHVVVARSTMLPGSVEKAIIPVIEKASGKTAGIDFGAAMNPEFLRESTSIHDFYHPPVTVVGELDKKSGDRVEAAYHFLDAPFVRTEIKTAEMIKYANNAFHALKVTFANEIGTICKAMDIDGHQVMDIFCMDHKLNLSSYYLKPGFAFGGSCLPKDLRAIQYHARQTDADVPVIGSILESNRLHIERAVQSILQSGKKKIGILGLSFKAGTDDLRESPLVILTETLIGKGFDIKIYDKNVSLAKLVGANKEYIEKGIPHISSLMRPDIEEVVSHGEIVIIGNKSKEFQDAFRYASEDTLFFDLVRVIEDGRKTHPGYEGICW